MAVYVLDSNVFIESKKRHYAFDIAPGFWKALVDNASEGKLTSIDRVWDEVSLGNDDLTVWANKFFYQYFETTNDAAVVAEFRKIMQWFQKQSQYQQFVRDSFAKGADGWLVAFAKVKGFVVVTEEKLDRGTKNKIPIPNVCQEFNVSYCDTFDMLRKLGVKLG